MTLTSDTAVKKEEYKEICTACVGLCLCETHWPISMATVFLSPTHAHVRPENTCSVDTRNHKHTHFPPRNCSWKFISIRLPMRPAQILYTFYYSSIYPVFFLSKTTTEESAT